MSALPRLLYKGRTIKAITLDVTGTLLRHKYPIAKTYADAAVWARLKNPPSEAELHPAFKQAYKETLLKYPYFRHSSNAWWKVMLKRTIEITGRENMYDDREFDRYYTRVYQHYGSLDGYEVFPDVLKFLDFITSQASHVILGVVSNCPSRTVDQVLPMMQCHKYFNFFLCAETFGSFKPDPSMFEEALVQAKWWGEEGSNISAGEVLHIGDAAVADFHGARAAGFAAALLDRKDNVAYNEWLVRPDYPTKEDDFCIEKSTYTDLEILMKDMNIE